jgi:DNA-binding MarR family transcriptional regulator
MRKTSPALSPTDPETVTRLRMALLRVGRRLRQQTHTGITPSQLSALSTVHRHGPLTLGDLAGLENVQPPSISRIVGALEGEGYVERTADDSDRRVALVEITTKGADELDQIRKHRDEWLADRLDALTIENRRRVLDALPAIEQLLAEEEPT